MDAIALLKHDHRTVEDLFKSYEKAGDRAFKSKREIVDSMIRELSIHAAIEEAVFYPAARNAESATTSTVLESLEEHHIVKWVLSELEGMDPHDEAFQAKVTVLIENVRHHVEEEEKELFPLVQKGLSKERLAELGSVMEDAKTAAPTHPHPQAPSTPPGNLVANLVSGVVDRAKDRLKQAIPG